MDHDGDLVVVELKKELTPREVTAQAIDYASCLADLTLEELVEQYLQFSDGRETLNEAYKKKYGTVLEEDSINNNVKMVIVSQKWMIAPSGLFAICGTSMKLISISCFSAWFLVAPSA